MPKFTSEKIMSHSWEKMFDLVADIEAYPLFLPMCEDLKIRSRKVEGGNELLLADMTIGYKLLRETFTTTVLLDKPQGRIDVHYVDGPFKHLENLWTFQPIDNNPNMCRVGFFIDYSFKNPMFSMLLSGLFDSVFKKFTHAFETRANEIYKEKSLC